MTIEERLDTVEENQVHMDEMAVFVRKAGSDEEAERFMTTVEMYPHFSVEREAVVSDTEKGSE